MNYKESLIYPKYKYLIDGKTFKDHRYQEQYDLTIYDKIGEQTIDIPDLTYHHELKRYTNVLNSDYELYMQLVWGYVAKDNR